jgi:hypothetical protein
MEVSYSAVVIHLATGKPEQERDIHLYGTSFSAGVSIRPLHPGVIAHISNGRSMKFTRCPDQRRCCRDAKTNDLFGKLRWVCISVN